MEKVLSDQTFGRCSALVLCRAGRVRAAAAPPLGLPDVTTVHGGSCGAQQEAEGPCGQRCSIQQQAHFLLPTPQASGSKSGTSALSTAEVSRVWESRDSDAWPPL